MSVTETNPNEIAKLAVDVLPRLMRAIAVLVSQYDETGAVGVTQFRILKRLAQRPWLVSELAHSLQLSVPTVSVAVDSLVRRGLVEREEAPHDRRATILQLTPAGQRSCDVAQERVLAALLQIVERLPVEDQSALAAGLTAVGRALDDVKSGSNGSSTELC